MEKQTCTNDGNVKGECSDDDLLKGSDDAMNVVKSAKHTSDISSVLYYKIKYICSVVFVIGIVVTVAMIVVISNGISRMSNQLESLSSKINSQSSRTDGQQKCGKINTSYLCYALPKENRRLRDELKKTKSKKDDQKEVFQLSKNVSKISNQLESLSSKIDNHSSRTDGPQTCDKVNTSYLYYALKEENRRLEDELKKTKSNKDDKKNGLQLSKDISRISNQIESLSKKIDSHSSRSDGPQQCAKINTSYLYYVIQEENRNLRAELQKSKHRKDSITCAENDYKSNQQEGRKEQSKFSCNSASSANNIYEWVVANRTLSFGCSDNFNLIMKIKLFYPEIPDNGKTLFEFGLTTFPDDFGFNHPVIIVRGQRCEKEPGMCLYVIDNVLTKLEDNVFDQMSDYIQGQLTLGLHKSFFVLMSNQKNIYISNMLNISSDVKLWPVFRFYNTHLINISQTIFSENKIGFNRTTVDPHLFVSEENNTISNYKLWSERTSFTEWDFGTAYFVPFIILFYVYLLMFHEKPEERYVQIISNMYLYISLFLVYYFH